LLGAGFLLLTLNCAHISDSLLYFFNLRTTVDWFTFNTSAHLYVFLCFLYAMRTNCRSKSSIASLRGQISFTMTPPWEGVRVRKWSGRSPGVTVFPSAVTTNLSIKFSS